MNRILITNDDSVTASQLLPLIRVFQCYGEITCIVPRLEQSGKSHGIEIRNSFACQEVMLEDVKVWTVDSTPADCVRFGIFGLKKEFDLVVSGINRGFNVGADMMYSGTVAAICEAALFGIPAIALSTSPGYYEEAVNHVDSVMGYLNLHKLWDAHKLYNINIPRSPKGFRYTRQGGPYFSDDFLVENGMVTPKGKCVYEESGDTNLDTDAVTMGYISITPVTINMTDMTIYKQLLQQDP